MPEYEDAELITRAQSGDARAFESLVESCYEVMFKMAYKWCGKKEEAEDITQEACIRLARGLGSFRHECAFTSWLYRLVINTAKDWGRAQARRPAASEDDPGYINAASAENAEDTLYAQQIWAQVSKLPDGEREALLLVMAQGLSHKETANLLGVKESTISWRIHEARKKLESALGKEKAYG